MAKKAKKENVLNVEGFLKGLEELEKTKNISKDSLINALIESIEKAYVKYLKGGDDAVVKATFDEANGVTVCQIKKVVEDVQDDYLEVGIDEIDNPNNMYKVGDDYPIYANINELNDSFYTALKNNLRQKIAEAERAALYEIYKNKIGEMIYGTVERADDNHCLVNIGKTVVSLTRREMIGEETFKDGQRIKLYVADVSTSSKGSISVTRSDEGFLKRLFEEEIHEIYDGTVLIKNIVRKAGIRSKVAVLSTDPDVDANGACIGRDGNRILKIVNQLGNTKDKEKIDIVSYTENQAIYIMDALKPADVVGVRLNIQEEGAKRKALAVVKDGQLSVSIGRQGANSKLAVKLTGWDILIKEESAAREDGLEFYTREECERIYAPVVEKSAQEVKEVVEEVSPVVEQQVETIVSETPVKEQVIEKVAPVEKKEEVKEEVKVEIKTTTTLESLEAQLEEEKEKTNKNQQHKRKPRKITNEEVEEHKTVDEKEVLKKKESYMEIYTEEELRQMEEEEVENSYDDYEDEDIDYDEYDSYYDDDK